MSERLFDDITPEVIQSRVFDALTLPLDTREGSYTQSVVAPSALEMWKVYQSFNSIEPMVRVDATSGEYLVRECESYGITPKPGTQAITPALVFSGADGTVIPAGKLVLTVDGLQYATTAESVIADGQATVGAEAVDVGEKYNVEPGTIVRQYTSTPGVRAVANTEAAVGGTEPETAESLFARLDARRKNPTTSGNKHHYEEWARSVDGVGDAKCIPLVEGPGTVGVLIVGPNRQPVDEAIVARCYDHIETQRPVGAEVYVDSAEALTVHVSAQVQVAATTDLETVQDAFAEQLDAYLKNISFAQYTLPYVRIGWILAGIDGVVDYTELMVNGGVDNVIIPDNAVPVLGVVTLT